MTVFFSVQLWMPVFVKNYWQYLSLHLFSNKKCVCWTCRSKIVISLFSLISSQHQSCSGGVKQAGRMRGKDTQPVEEDPVRRHGQLPDQAGQWPPGLLVSAFNPARSCAAGVPQHLHCLLPLFLPNPSSAVGLPLWPAQLPGPGQWQQTVSL